MIADVALRQFLLGAVDAEERLRIEGLFVTDAAFSERLLAIEQDLIDDYFEGALSEVERERFRKQYAATVSQREKLEVSRSVKEWADNQLRTTPSLKPRSIRWLRPMIAAVVVVVALLLILWVSNKLEHRRHLAQEQELAQLNSQSALAQVPAGMQSSTLSPINTRTIDQQLEVETGAAQVIELRLFWIQKERYPAYRAVFKRVKGSEAFTIQDLRAEQDEIRLRIPAKLLTRGQFRIVLTGVTTEGGDGLSEEYDFSARQ
jgi:hypothetical protein